MKKSMLIITVLALLAVKFSGPLERGLIEAEGGLSHVITKIVGETL